MKTSKQIYPPIERIINHGHFPEHDKAIEALEVAELRIKDLENKINTIYKYKLN